jgi:hypothetical protein
MPLLQAALEELTDDELAQRLNVHVGTIKKRWLEIYNRLSEKLPNLLLKYEAADDSPSRGKQKRHHVLAYVREHPEELRPYGYRQIRRSTGQRN